MLVYAVWIVQLLSLINTTEKDINEINVKQAAYADDLGDAGSQDRFLISWDKSASMVYYLTTNQIARNHD